MSPMDNHFFLFSNLYSFHFFLLPQGTIQNQDNVAQKWLQGILFSHSWVTTQQKCIHMCIKRHAQQCSLQHYSPQAKTETIQNILQQYKVCYSHTMEFYTAVKMNRPLLHTMWINLINIMLHDRRQDAKEHSLNDLVI